VKSFEPSQSSPEELVKTSNLLRQERGQGDFFSVKSLATALIAFALLTLIGCGSPSNMEAKAPQLAGELVLYNWAEDLPIPGRGS
jgi:hypothetical protein